MKLLKIPKFGAHTTFGELIDGWSITYQMRTDANGEIVIGRLTIKAEMHSPADVVKPVPVGGIDRELLDRFQLRAWRSYGRAVIATQRPEGKRAAAGRSGSARGRRPSLTVSYVKRVWRRYVQLVETHQRDYAKRLADEFRMNRSTMRGLLRRCHKDERLRGIAASVEPSRH